MPTITRRPMLDRYFELVRRFPLVRIANDSELADALATVDDLLTREMDAGQEAYLDTNFRPDSRLRDGAPLDS